MSSLIASFDKDRLKKLVDLNMIRGNLTSSVSSINLETREVTVQRFDQPLVDEAIDNHFKDGSYNIVHMQAHAGPSSGIQPAESKTVDDRTGYLWHNGQLLGYPEQWDTMALCQALGGHKGYKALNEFRGSMACIYVVDGSTISVFRNSLAPLYMSPDCDISSTAFEGGEPITSDVVLELTTVDNKALKSIEVMKFVTANDPYHTMV